MTPPELDDTDYLVWPFRRQLVDETVLSDERTLRVLRPLPARSALPPPPAPRRGAPAPLRLALPVCCAVFLAAAAATAAFSRTDDVAAPQLVRAAAAAVPHPARVRHRTRPRPRPTRAVAAVPPAAAVASVVGLDKRAAAEALLAGGYGVRIYGVPSSLPLDQVVAQSPAAGTKLPAGAYVRINVSAG